MAMAMRQQAANDNIQFRVTKSCSSCRCRSAFWPVFVGFFASSIAGCGAKVLVPNEADALREELATRTSERNAARARVAELETEVASLLPKTPQFVNPEAAAATPMVASVAISSLSTARMTGDSTATLAVVMVPSDGLGRFLQITGTLEISGAVLIPGAEPQLLAPRTVGPKELRESYRSGFLGTHYTIELPCEWTRRGVAPATGVAVSTLFTDAWTGKGFASTATVPILPNTLQSPTSASAAARLPTR